MLNICYVFFKNPAHSYATSMSEQATSMSAKKYFLNTVLDCGYYPQENMQECIGICFIDKNKGTTSFYGECSKENLEKFYLFLDYELVKGL